MQYRDLLTLHLFKTKADKKQIFVKLGPGLAINTKTNKDAVFSPADRVYDIGRVRGAVIDHSEDILIESRNVDRELKSLLSEQHAKAA